MIFMINKPNYYYTIAQTSQITGLTKETIRKWEERYQLIQPKRLKNGYRQYTQQDILCLFQIQKFVRQGSSIREAMEKTTPTLDYHPQIVHYLFQLLEYGYNCDEVAFHCILTEAQLMLNIEEFLNELITPFLYKVGDNWENKIWYEYQETLASAIIRDFLAVIRRNLSVNSEQPLIIGACLPGEQHEIAMEMLLIQASIKGYRNLMIGSSPSVSTIEQLVDKLKPTIVLLSAATLLPFEHYPDELANLEKFAEKQATVRFIIGGEGARRYIEAHPFKHIQFCNELSKIFTS